MRESVVRAAGLAGTVLYGAAIVWMYAAQPQTVAEVTGGLTSTIGAYRIDQQAFQDGLAFFKRDQFDEARAALSRADPAGRDAQTQFYIAYTYYRQGWGRLYSDDVLFKNGLAGGRSGDCARARSPAGRRRPGYRHTHGRRAPGRAAARADERRLGLQPPAADQAKAMSPLREAFVLPCLFLTVALLGGLRLGADVRLVPPPLVALVLAVLLLGSLVRSGVIAHERLLGSAPDRDRERLRERRCCSRCSRRRRRSSTS